MRLFHEILLRLNLRSVASNTTIIDFFEDDACQNAAFKVETDTNSYNGQCGGLSGINSVNVTMLAPDCTGKKPLNLSE